MLQRRRDKDIMMDQGLRISQWIGLLLFTFLTITANSSPVMNAINKASAKNERLLFVFSSESSNIVQVSSMNPIASQKFIVTLHGVNPTVTYFDEPPQSLVGSISTADFVNHWSLITTDDPQKPNVALHATSKRGTLELLTVLSFENPTYNAATHTLQFTGTERSTQSDTQTRTGRFGPTTLFLG